MSKQQKSVLLPSGAARPTRSYQTLRLFALVSLAVLWGIYKVYDIYGNIQSVPSDVNRAATLSEVTKPLCPQVESRRPVKNAELYYELDRLVESDAYQELTVQRLAEAVKIPTESDDDMGPVGLDPRWEIFAAFHVYLRKAFPLVHEALELTKVNTYGLVYHWQGSDSALKPLLITAHQDVNRVNPNSVNEWVHPPFSGHFDGTYVWGRGTCDDKSALISSLSAVETLLENGFMPTRTLVLSFGFDVEASGVARTNVNYLQDSYGDNAFALLVDEGGGWSEVFGQVIAMPAVGEKTYLDVRIEVNMPGGHSSIPPPHTSIGILASLLVAIESNPYTPRINRTQPPYDTLQCLAEYAPNMPASLREDIKLSITSDQALRRAEEYVFAHDSEMRATVGITQSIDLMTGGSKQNSLPEQAVAIINHRIPTDSSADIIVAHLTNLSKPLASVFNLSVNAFGTDMLPNDEPRYGTLSITNMTSLPAPLPIAPTDSEAFKLLSSTIKASLLDSDQFRSNKNRSIVIAPGVLPGNTGSLFYWPLTPNVFRYYHLGSSDMYTPRGIHGVNEAVKIMGILRQIRFYFTLILNADENSIL